MNVLGTLLENPHKMVHMTEQIFPGPLFVYTSPTAWLLSLLLQVLPTQ
jgi:hypothetical protein